MSVERVCFVGASNVEGVGDEERRGWAGRATFLAPAKASGARFYNLGIGGETTDLIRARWRGECTPRIGNFENAAIVVSFGLNDTAEQEGPGIEGRRLRLEFDQTLANVRAAAAEMLEWRPTLWIGPTPVVEDMMPMVRPGGLKIHLENARLETLNAAYKEVADDVGVPYLDFLTPLLASEAYMDSLRERDGLHPSGAGYQQCAEMLAAWDAWQGLF